MLHLVQPDELNRSIGENVAYLRGKAGWSQAQLAERWGAKLGRKVDPTTVTRLERGKRPIAVHELAALRTVFGLRHWDDLVRPPLEYRLASYLEELEQGLRESYNKIKGAAAQYLELQV